jgi:hypothetical protein
MTEIDYAGRPIGPAPSAPSWAGGGWPQCALPGPQDRRTAPSPPTGVSRGPLGRHSGSQPQTRPFGVAGR